jgi:hypothetical protein
MKQRDTNGYEIYLRADGAGTDTDPFIPHVVLEGGGGGGGGSAGNLVLSLPGGTEATHVNHGFFWPAVQGYDLGNGFLWESWVQPTTMAGSGYLVSDGYGGAHSLLWGLGSVPGAPTGNLWNGSTSISFGGGYMVAASEWVHLALLWTKTAIYSFVNGVCDGQVAFTGPRVTPAPGGPGVLYVGGSDHLNLAMSIAALRGYDRGLPFSTNTTWGTAFRPERRFGIDAARSTGTGTRQPDFLADYTVQGVTIPDHSPAGCVSWLQLRTGPQHRHPNSCRRGHADGGASVLLQGNGADLERRVHPFGRGHGNSHGHHLDREPGMDGCGGGREL